MEPIDRFMHALHILLLDPELEIQIFVNGDQPTFKVTASTNRFKVMFQGHNKEYVALPDKSSASLYETVAWMEKLCPGGIVRSANLFKRIKYRDECISYTTDAVIPLW